MENIILTEKILNFTYGETCKGGFELIIKSSGPEQIESTINLYLNGYKGWNTNLTFEDFKSLGSKIEKCINRARISSSHPIHSLPVGSLFQSKEFKNLYCVVEKDGNKHAVHVNNSNTCILLHSSNWCNSEVVYYNGSKPI